MLPWLPAHPLDRAPRRRPLVPVLALALLVVTSGVAHALELTLGTPYERGGWVVVDARLDELFEDRVQQSLERGIPATIEMHAELWRRRGLWFGALEHTFDATVRIQLGDADPRFVIDRAGASSVRFATLDSVADYLGRPWSLPVGRLAPLHPDARHYVVVTVTLRPLSAEDARAVEGWINGDPSTGPDDGITALPRGVFDAVRNVTGFGDRRARATSEDFVPDRLDR